MNSDLMSYNVFKPTIKIRVKYVRPENGLTADINVDEYGILFVAVCMSLLLLHLGDVRLKYEA